MLCKAKYLFRELKHPELLLQIVRKAIYISLFSVVSECIMHLQLGDRLYVIVSPHIPVFDEGKKKTWIFHQALTKDERGK